jgi:sugar/nucleoside kinase (ribokinase family)
MLDIRVDAETLRRGGDVHGRVSLQPGGSSANAAVWAVWSGGTATVYGRVGDDLAGGTLTQALSDRGVETRLTVDRAEPTGTMLVVHEPGERSMAADRGANARLTQEDLPARLDAMAVLVSGYLFLQDPGHDAAVAALERSASSQFLAVDAASWPLVEAFGADRFFEETVAANVVLANEREARSLTGIEGADAAAALGERYRTAAVKLGDRGAALVVDGQLLVVPAESVEELDSTGAGDAFDGVLLGALANGVDPAQALRLACHAGAKVAGSAQGWPQADP